MRPSEFSETSKALRVLRMFEVATMLLISYMIDPNMAISNSMSSVVKGFGTYAKRRINQNARMLAANMRRWMKMSAP